MFTNTSVRVTYVMYDTCINKRAANVVVCILFRPISGGCRYLVEELQSCMQKYYVEKIRKRTLGMIKTNTNALFTVDLQHGVAIYN